MGSLIMDSLALMVLTPMCTECRTSVRYASNDDCRKTSSSQTDFVVIFWKLTYSKIMQSTQRKTQLTWLSHNKPNTTFVRLKQTFGGNIQNVERGAQRYEEAAAHISQLMNCQSLEITWRDLQCELRFTDSCGCLNTLLGYIHTFMHR